MCSKGEKEFNSILELLENGTVNNINKTHLIQQHVLFRVLESLKDPLYNNSINEVQELKTKLELSIDMIVDFCKDDSTEGGFCPCCIYENSEGKFLDDGSRYNKDDPEYDEDLGEIKGMKKIDCQQEDKNSYDIDNGSCNQKYGKECWNIYWRNKIEENYKRIIL